MDNKKMRELTGNMTTDDRLSALFYVLMRDHIPAGVLEMLVTEIEENEKGFIFTNGFLAGYAELLSERIKGNE